MRGRKEGRKLSAFTQFTGSTERREEEKKMKEDWEKEKGECACVKVCQERIQRVNLWITSCRLWKG